MHQPNRGTFSHLMKLLCLFSLPRLGFRVHAFFITTTPKIQHHRSKFTHPLWSAQNDLTDRSSTNNEVWVTWTDPSSNEDLNDKVTGLSSNRVVYDLCEDFVKQQYLQNVDPVAVKVRETKNGQVLEEDAFLKQYFVPPEGRGEGPGQSEDTALFLTLSKEDENSKKRPYDSLPTPSAFGAGKMKTKNGELTGWAITQEDDSMAIMCGRPFFRLYPDAALVFPGFQDIRIAMVSGTPEARDFELAAELSSEMPNYFEFDGNRRDCVNEIINRHIAYGLGVSLVSRLIRGPSQSDGCTWVNGLHGGINFEYNNQPEQGRADPYMECGLFCSPWSQ